MITEVEILWSLAVNRERGRQQAQLIQIIALLIDVLRETRPEVAEAMSYILKEIIANG